MGNLYRLLQNNRRDVVCGAIAAIVIVADQLTKAWIRGRLAEGQVFRDWGWVQIIHVQNTGASFGFLKGHINAIIIGVFLEILVIGFFIYLLRNYLKILDNWWIRVGAGLVMGGAIGNQIDRLAMGHVTDFIDFKWFPTWNIADGSAVVGSCIIAVCLLFLARREKRKA
jgi:signal peptidase II